MLQITLLCNAGLAMEYEGAVLIVDAPNCEYGVFYKLPEKEWQNILQRQPPFDGVCGLYFTHNHPDHCDLRAVRQYQNQWPQTPVFLPDGNPDSGTVHFGPFEIEFQRFAHAPLPQGVPPHVVTWIQAGAHTVYLSADAELDCAAHRAFLKGRKADAAFWNAMYLSRPETRSLLSDAAHRSYIYHMPASHADSAGMWRKCDRNFERYGAALRQVEVLGAYPSKIIIS